MADPRYYAKLDVGYFDNPKTSSLLDDNPRALILHLRAIVYCRQHLTDGTFPIRAVTRLACASHCGSHCESQCDFCTAVEAGLLTRIDSKYAEVHDYLKHQESAKQVDARRSAGRKAAAAKWGGDRNADGNANRIADGNAVANAEERRGEERTLVEAEASKPRKKPAHTLPEDWKPTTAHQKYAEERSVDLSSEAFRFRNHADSLDRRVVNWNSAFTNWLSKSYPDRNQPKAPGDRRPEGW